MTSLRIRGLLVVAILCGSAGAGAGAPTGGAVDAYFRDEVWGKVGERTCLNCHSPGGDAEESKFRLRDTSLEPGLIDRNREAFEKQATQRKDGKSRLLLKVAGGLEHGGGAQLKPGSTGYKILEEYVLRLEGKGAREAPAELAPSFFKSVEMISPRRLLRRVTLQLGARLPTPEEVAAVDKDGLAAVDRILDAVMQEPAFYARLQEGFNDIFLTLGYTGNADDALSYDHFEKTRHWAEKFDLSQIPEKERQKARYAVWNDYRKALLREPLELITHIVRENRPFTEIVTANYLMVSPYTARGYGIYEGIKDQFKNPEDPFEYIEARLPALKGRDGKTQKTETGYYPHAGLLTMFQYLRRYPTTVTNRNRLRSRMYYQHFLGIDVMALAPRVTDAAAIGKKFANPTLQAPDCVVCHKTIDPVAGLFQDYFNEEGHYGPRKEGWFTDMFGPGREGAAMPAERKWNSLQWLGQETARDPRFAVAMVEHVYAILMGRKVSQAPQDIDDPLFTPKRRAHQELRREIRDLAAKFTASNFNLRAVFKGLVASPFYRADGLSEAVKNPARRAELDDIGVVRLLTPEQLERKIEAVFGSRWGRLNDSDQKFAILYGGIDSKEVTQRMSDPSGAMGAIQRIMANDVACKNVSRDFAQEPSKRRLFPSIEPDVTPDDGPDAERKIREAVVHLHEVILGRTRAADHPEIERTYRLFADIIADAHARKGLEPLESYFCKGGNDKVPRPKDPDYGMRAWRAVVTFLLRQDDFLYE